MARHAWNRGPASRRNGGPTSPESAQVQLAELLDTAQQTITAYESGRRRVPVSALPAIAKILGVSVEELIGDEPKAAAKRGPAPKLQQQMERITRLPKAQQRFVMQMLDTVLAQAGR